MMNRERLWKIGEKPVVLAHRGGGNEVPENSIDAFRRMRERGFRFVETDCHATKDGVVVIFHDPILERTTDGRGKISRWTWRDLREVRDESGHRIVRLDELLEEFPDMIFNIDAKHNGVARPMAEIISRLGAIDRVSLASFSETRLRYIRRLLPGVRSSMGTSAIARLVLASNGPTSLRRAALYRMPGPEQGVECIQVPELFRSVRIINGAFVALAHSRGLAVHVWTVNEERVMRKLLDLGVDGLITDEPRLARSVIDEMFGGGD